MVPAGYRSTFAIIEACQNNPDAPLVCSAFNADFPGDQMASPPR
jgi:hypothetical protein